MEQDLGRSRGWWNLERNGGIPTPAMLLPYSHIHSLRGMWVGGAGLQGTIKPHVNES